MENGTKLLITGLRICVHFVAECDKVKLDLIVESPTPEQLFPWAPINSDATGQTLFASNGHTYSHHPKNSVSSVLATLGPGTCLLLKYCLIFFF